MCVCVILWCALVTTTVCEDGTSVSVSVKMTHLLTGSYLLICGCVCNYYFVCVLCVCAVYLVHGCVRKVCVLCIVVIVYFMRVGDYT